jgi:YVTN family beta-propeller protein
VVNAYIANEGDGVHNSTVSVIDGTTVVATPTVGVTPTSASVSPDGRKVYVANYGSGTVSVIDTSSKSVVKTISSGIGTNPFNVAFSPNGVLAFISNNGSGTVSVINTYNDTAVASSPITVGTDPSGVAVSPDGTTLYVANAASNSVSVIDIASLTVTHTITTGIGTDPFNLAVSPDGSTLYVTNNGSGTGNTVSIIDTATRSPVMGSPVTVGTSPCNVAFTPDGTKAFVTNGVSNSISVINTSTLAVTNSTSGIGTEPYGISITPDGTEAYVPNAASNSVSIISTTSPYGAVAGSPVSVGTAPASNGTFIQPPSIPMTNIYVPPQGRLTLTSNTPVMTADVTGATSVYYTPYQGNIVPIYDGANIQSYTFGQLTMTLNTSNQTSGNIYDLFVFLNSSVVTIGAGPGWSNATPGSCSRGSGANTTELQVIDGLWTNANTITLKNGSTTYSNIAANEATYIGSVYMTANGQTGFQMRPAAAAGGSNNILGIYNAYNRVLIKAGCSDSTASYSYTSSTVRNANGSASNRISWVDGLQQSVVDIKYHQSVTGSNTANVTLIAVGLNSSSITSLTKGLQYASGTATTSLGVDDNVYPQLGLNYMQALEGGSATIAYFNVDGSAGLFISLEI